MAPLLEIKNLVTQFNTEQGVLKAVDGLNLTIQRGSIHALVGESGCGKSMTALSILRLISPPGEIAQGEIIYHPQQGSAVNLLKLSESEMRKLRGNRIAMIFQEPMTSLNPVYTVGDQIAEAVELHQKVSKKEAWHRATEMLKKVGIPNPAQRVHEYPHQMSGGMRQRVMIAMALSCNPDLLIADEPTTALDVTIQAQILNLMHQLIKDLNMALLLITHDFGVVAEHAEEVSVMYAGEVVEQAHVKNIFQHPHHPYTKGLLESIPGFSKITTDAKSGIQLLNSIPGNVPGLAELPQGCYFQDRCERVQGACRGEHPELKDGEHRYRCVNAY